MDVVNFDALVAQGKILLASQVNPDEDYFIIGKHDNTYTTRSFKATDYPIWAIKAKDVVGLTEPTAYYSHNLATGSVINVNTKKGVIEITNLNTYTPTPLPAMASALPVMINNTTMDYSDPDKVYLQLTPYYDPAVLDTFIPYLLPTGVSSGSVINLYNLSPAVAGANQFTGKFYLYYETYNF